MRLWHKDLVPVLPRQQLLGQWRECCLIARNIALHGSPHHMLVNKIVDYPLADFIKYTKIVINTLKSRGYKCDTFKFLKWVMMFKHNFEDENNSNTIFENWHNERYLIQCFYNLQEKYDCGGISQEEWELINSVVKNI